MRSKGCVIALLMTGLWLVLTGDVRSEPLSQSTRFPLMFMVLTPEPQSPLLPEGRATFTFSADYSTVFMNKATTNWYALVDMEVGVITPGGELRIGERVSLGCSLPFVHLGAGFADNFLEDYHDLGNFPDYGRSYRPHDEFAYEVTKDGRTWFNAEKNGIHLSDSRVSLKYLFRSSPDLAVTGMISLKIPTGDETQGFGSGRMDQGYFLLTRMANETGVFYLSPGLILPQDPKTLGASIDFKPMVCLFTGIECRLNETWSLNGQVNMFQSPLRNTDIAHLDQACMELALGATCRLRPGLVWDMSFTEDLAGPSADFTLRTGFRFDSGF